MKTVLRGYDPKNALLGAQVRSRSGPVRWYTVASVTATDGVVASDGKELVFLPCGQYIVEMSAESGIARNGSRIHQNEGVGK